MTESSARLIAVVSRTRLDRPAWSGVIVREQAESIVQVGIAEDDFVTDAETTAERA